MGIAGVNLNGRTVIIRATSMKDKNATEAERTFLCTGGFGCDASSSGTKVFGTWVSDGTEDWVRRGDVESVLTLSRSVKRGS
jgi:hypothetical protein